MLRSKLAYLFKSLAAPADYVLVGGSAAFGLIAYCAVRADVHVASVALLLAITLSWAAGAFSSLLVLRIIDIWKTVGQRSEALWVTVGGIAGVLATTAMFTLLPALEAATLFKAGSDIALTSVQWLIGVGAILALGRSFQLSR